MGKAQGASGQTWEGCSFKSFERLTIIFEASVLGQASCWDKLYEIRDSILHIYFSLETARCLFPKPLIRGVFSFTARTCLVINKAF